ncbi:YwaF family protein, partial [Saccharopolyspora elongata]|uniref:YwaF family protein n=1 Tax=Saccharopolyspora elongata TaxID=2530387 RepID=UPI001A9E85CE
AAGAVVLVWLGRRHREARSGQVFARTFAVVIVLFAATVLVYGALASGWDIGVALPFHLSDLAWMAAAYTLWTRHQWSYALTYYWGLTLSTIAMITPAIEVPDFPHIDFVDFWAEHAMVVWAVIYLTWGLGMRPDWRSYAIAVSTTLAWGVAALGFNTVAGTNYGFVNAKPNAPSPLDLMGDWPWYLGVEVVLGLAVWALITWPWTRSRGAASSGQPVEA